MIFAHSKPLCIIYLNQLDNYNILMKHFTMSPLNISDLFSSSYVLDGGDELIGLSE